MPERVDSASRTEPPRERIPALNGLRGFLTIGVLLQHVFASVTVMFPDARLAPYRMQLELLSGSEIALPIYFVISGLVMFLPAARTGGSLGSLRWYAVRRIARIVPAYWVSIAVLLFIWPRFFPEVPSPMTTTHGVGVVVGHLALAQTMLFSQNDLGFGLNGSVWSLTHEETFYVLLPLMAAAFARRPIFGLGIGLVVSVIWRLAALHLPEVYEALGREPPSDALPLHMFRQAPGYAFQFACGMATAIVYVRLSGKLTSSRWQRTLVVTHAVCAAVLVVLTIRAGIHRVLLNGIVRDIQRDMIPAVVFAVMLLAVVFGPPWARRAYDNVACRFLGDVSYGIYLSHMILMQLVYRLAHLADRSPPEAVVWLVAAVVPGSILVGWISFRFVERPITRYARRLRDERRAALDVAASRAPQS